MTATQGTGLGLEFYDACWCAGTGCGGHLPIRSVEFTPIGWQVAAQHTWTPGCAGHHAPGRCPVAPASHTILSLPAVT
jgi:hypothetical protein